MCLHEVCNNIEEGKLMYKLFLERNPYAKKDHVRATLNYDINVYRKVFVIFVAT